jgi:predicted nucleic acid-binding protein
MELAAAGLFRAKWTDEIHDEWIKSLLERRPELEQNLKRTRALINKAIQDCLIEGYEDLIPSVECPDPNDRHVIAAAIKGRCSAIITFNLKDFPVRSVEKYDIEVQHPDEFLHHQTGLDLAGVISAARRIRARLKNPVISSNDYLRRLAAQGLPKTVAELSQYSSVI